jgi:GT2 family glycosyltransferase
MTDGRLSAVIPTCNRPECLLDCLRALADQTERPEAVYLIDDGEQPISNVARRFDGALRITILRTLRAGPAAARNAALPLIKTEYVGFLDDDSIPAPGWVASCVALFRSRLQVTAQLGRIRWTGPGTGDGFRRCFFPNFRQKLFDSRHVLFTDDEFRRTLQVALAREIPDDLSVATHLSGGNSAIRVEYLRRQGGFDLRYRTLSDREMAWRILRQGGLIAYNPQMEVRHRHDPSIQRALRRCFYTAPYQRLLGTEYSGAPWISGGWQDPIRIKLTPAERLFVLLHRIVRRLGLYFARDLPADPLVSRRN